MAFTFLQGNSIGGSANKDLAFSSDVTAGSLLVLCCRNADGTNAVTNVTDDVNGSWTQGVTVGPDADNNSLEMWYYVNASAGTTTTSVVGSMTDAFIKSCIAEYSAPSSLTLIDSSTSSQAGTDCNSGTANNSGATGDVLAVGGAVTAANRDFTAGGTGSTFTARNNVTQVRSMLQDDTTAADGNTESIPTCASVAYTHGGLLLLGEVSSGTTIEIPTGPVR